MTDVYDQLLDEQKPATVPAAPVAPAQGKDAYDTILDEFQGQQDNALQQTLTQALDVLPQNAATTQQLAKSTGLPEDVVERNKDTVQKQVKLREIQSLLASSPILARQMQDPAFAKLAQNDANTLSTIERLWRQPTGGAVEGVGMGTAGIGDVLGIVQRNLSEGFARTFLPTPIGGWDKVDNASLAGPLLGADWQTVGNYLKQQGRDIQIPQLQQTFFDKVLAGVGQVGSQVAVGALTGGAGSSAFLFGQGANAMTEKVQGDNASQGAKDLAVLAGAGVTALTEKWALDKLLGPMAVPIQNQLGAAFARIGIAGASEGAQETVESLAQDALRQYLTNPDAEIQVGQAFQEGGVGATVGALVRTVVEAAAGVRSRGARTEQQAANAERNAQFVEQLNQLAAASELLKTSPETFEQFIEQAAEDGDVQDVYIDAKFLMQSGMADQLAQVSPSVAQQLPAALATGGTVQIPVGEYAARVAPTEFAQGLLDHIKTDPQGFTRAEAQEYYQTQQQQLEQEIAQQLEAKTGDQVFMDSKERVKQTVLTELNNLGRFTPQKNELDATLIAARTAVRAAQLGITPEAFFEQQRLRFAAERIDGNTFNQADSKQIADQLKAEFPDVQLSLRGKGNSATLDKIIVPEGARSSGTGTKVMERLTAWADANGVTLSLSPSADFGGNKKRLGEFYKRFGFVDNKGKSKDYEISEAMYRAPQQYNQRTANTQNAVDKVDVPADYNVEPASPLQVNPELFTGPDGLSGLSDYERVAANLISLLNRSNDAVDVQDFTDMLKRDLRAAGIDASYVDAYDLLGDNFVLTSEVPAGKFSHKDAAVLLEIESGLELLGWMAGNMRGQDVIGSTEIDNARAAKTSVNRGESLAALRDQIIAEANKEPTRQQSGNVTAIRPGVFFQSEQMQTDTPAFKKWFGDSKVVDEQGKPLVVYHGSSYIREDFQRFRKDVVFFAESKAYASNWATGMKVKQPDGSMFPEGASVVPVYLSIQNPYNGDTGDLWLEEDLYDPDVVERLKAEGYDGAFWTDGLNTKNWVSFYPTQIKSATGNAGTFGLNNPNILFQSGQPGVKDLPDAIELRAYLYGREGLSVVKLVDLLRATKAAAPDLHIAADGEYGPIAKDVAEQIPNVQLIIAKDADRGFAMDAEGHAYTIFKGRVIDHKQKDASEAIKMSHNVLRNLFGEMRNNDPAEVQRRQEQERRDAIESARSKRIENAPKLSGDFKADMQALADYAENFDEFKRLLTADMLDTSNRNRTRLARATVALEPNAVTAANVMEKEPSLVEDYLLYGTSTEKSVASSLKSRSKQVTMYRGMPADQSIEAGDWVSFSRAYAKGHESNVEGKAATKQKTVSKDEVYWYGADVNEWVYVPKGTFGDVKTMRELWESLGQGGKPDTYPEQLYNQFVGRNARNVPLEQLTLAKQMEAQGASSARIQRDTGWTKGVDGMWRFEISDDQAKFKGSTVDTAAIAAEAERFITTQVVGNQYKAVHDNGNTMEWLATFGWTEEEARANLLRKLAERKGGDGFDINKVKTGQMYALGEVLDHPELFAAYPYMRLIDVSFVSGGDGTNGSFSPHQSLIELSMGRDKDAMLSTLLHEIQHAIQYREGFATGGNGDKTFTDAVKAAVNDLRQYSIDQAENWKRYNWRKLDDAESAAEIASNALKYQSAQRLIGYSKRDKPSGVFRNIRNEMQWIYGEQFYGNRAANDLQRMFYDLPKRGDKRNAFLRNMAFEGAQFLLDSIPAEQRQAFKEDTRTLQSLVKALSRQASKARAELAPLRELEAKAKGADYLHEKTLYKAPYEVYRALAGEIEARTTQARQKLTPEERRNRPVRQDMDVSPAEAIVVVGGREMLVPTVMQSAKPQGPRGAFNPENNTIALLKNADLSTFLHEAGHYFFESDIALAAEIAHGNNLMGADTMTPGEQEILNDVSTLFKWLGINGDINEQIAQWYSLSFEEKRAYHEKTAESFERYLFEGKAPSIELQSYFQQFRAWLVNVYKSITDFLNRNPAAGQLSDEVRAVFDRMLASTEEIQLAEQARSMMPLFRTKADADNIGMTEEEFRAYQKQETQATLDAIQDLQARGLRDLQWTRNARNREVKRLQRQAAELRSEARIDARAEVLSEPVYRAWQFLTRKMTEDDKITPYQRPKSDPNVVDPTIDSLFTAMAKLGGLDKQEAIDTWGVEESERPNSGVFGKPVLRKTGGKSIDGMVEALAQYGYLPIGTDGKADIADFEQKFDEELRGNTQYSLAYDYSINDAEQMRPGEGVNLLALGAGRLDLGALSDMGFTTAEIELLKARKMTAKDGLHPDLVAELPGVEMSSGDELVRKLLEANPLKEEIEARADAMMLERHGELATPEAIEREADKAIHNEARAKMVATEINALARATGERKILAKAAKALAETMVARLKIRDIKPTQYASAEARAAKAADKAMRDGNLVVAGAEKRSQLVNTYATKAAYDAQDEINADLRYLRKFEKEGARKGLDNDYLEQIDTLLERFDLRKGQSLKTIDKRTNLAAWIAAQEQAGIEPVLPDYILAEANRTHYKNLTVEEFRGLVDSVKQIEHLGRLKKKLLTAKDQRELDQIVEAIRERIEQSSGGRIVDNERRNTLESKLSHFGRWVNAAHRKAASVTRELDGLTDGGPMWEYFTRAMNEAGDREAEMRADAATRLHELAKPILTGEKMGGKGRFFPSLGRSLNRGERIAMALNWGNESNRQRLLGGKGWTVGQVQPVLDSLTSDEWNFVQGVWDFFESYRPEIAAKERRVYGKEPDWIEPAPFEITTADGKQMQIRGGYYPVKYDPMQSGKAGEFAEAEEAKAMMRAAYTAATTRRSFTKSRAEEVSGRPLLLTFDGIWQGANEVIHDLTWHEWLIDANRLLKRLDAPIRNDFGAEYVDVLRKAVKDVARGDTPASNAVEKSLTHIRNGSSIVGMGWNLTTALLQPLGLTNTAVRIGGKWLARGMSEFYGSPAKMIRVADEVQSKSKFMANRALTMNREIADIRNKLESDKSEIRQRIEGSFFILIQKMQAGVDYPTWLGAYAKAISDPANINQDGTINEERAVALADQAVIDAQGSGQMKDLAEVQRGHPLLKLFTNFYSYFNVLMNLTTETTKKRVRDKEYLGLAGDYVLLMVVPAVMSAIIRNALKGEDDEDKYAKDIAAELVGYPFGMFLGLRELAEAAKLTTGLGNPGIGYSGPAGLRFFSEATKLGQQIGQGELDMALFKALNNTAGLLFHYPAGQVNRAVEGAVELIEGKTQNPLAPLVGVQK